MTRDEFWKLIESIDREAMGDGDDHGAVEPLIAKLRSLNVPALESFDEHLARCLYALDGRAFFQESEEAAGSDDSFLYARCYVVACGRQHFESTLRNPKLMPKSVDHWCEALLNAHIEAWAEVTGKDESEWSFRASVSYESGRNEAQWQE